MGLAGRVPLDALLDGGAFSLEHRLDAPVSQVADETEEPQLFGLPLAMGAEVDTLNESSEQDPRTRRARGPFPSFRYDAKRLIGFRPSRRSPREPP